MSNHWLLAATFPFLDAFYTKIPDVNLITPC